MTEQTESTNPYGFDDPDDEECGWAGSAEAFHSCGDDDDCG